MAEKKKKRAAEFAKDKNAFTGGGSTKRDSDTQKTKQKQSGAHQPRDADITSGHDVQKSLFSCTWGIFFLPADFPAVKGIVHLCI